VLDERLNRHALSDEEWDRLGPLLPADPPPGVLDQLWIRRRNRGSAGGRPPAFDPARYKERNTVERCFSKLKQYRAVATRYDKREQIYQGTVDVASIRIWLHDPSGCSAASIGRRNRCCHPAW
jgi:transposase